MVEQVTHGDLNSNERGSGARKSAGKPRVDLVLWRQAAELVAGACTFDIVEAMQNLGRFQETGEATHLVTLVRNLYGPNGSGAVVQAAKVFEFGAAKYKAWNWAKGMAWSIPVGCIGRHLLAMCNGGLDSLDMESNLEHRAHVVCNVFMLLSYATSYQEGNDLPDPSYFRQYVPVVEAFDNDVASMPAERVEKVYVAEGYMPPRLTPMGDLARAPIRGGQRDVRTLCVHGRTVCKVCEQNQNDIREARSE